MKFFLCLSALASMLTAQAPPAAIPPDTVVAKVDGKSVTVADLNEMLAGTPPVLAQTLRQEPAQAITAIFLTHYAAQEAEKLQLDQRSPWKEQIEVARQQILLAAMTSHVADSFQVTTDETEAFYKQHESSYQQVKIKAIKINFKPEVKTSPDDLSGAARKAFETAHAATDRSEADARKMAEDVVKQARSGVEFSQLVDKYAEGESKDFAGDYPPVKQTSNYPEDIKKVVFAMKPGQISDPVRQSNSFYVIRVLEVSAQPINEVREAIIHQIRSAHVQQYVEGLRARFKTEIVRPDYFIQLSGSAAPGK